MHLLNKSFIEADNSGFDVIVFLEKILTIFSKYSSILLSDDFIGYICISLEHKLSASDSMEMAFHFIRYLHCSEYCDTFNRVKELIIDVILSLTFSGLNNTVTLLFKLLILLLMNRQHCY